MVKPGKYYFWKTKGELGGYYTLLDRGKSMYRWAYIESVEQNSVIIRWANGSISEWSLPFASDTLSKFEELDINEQALLRLQGEQM